MNEATTYINSQLPDHLKNVKIAVICGSGLSGLTSLLSSAKSILYKDILGFKVSTVHGHKAELVFGLIGEKRVPIVCMSGRLHTYEGWDIQDTVFPVKSLASLGIETLIVTNAAGGLNRSFKVGDIMIINDHLNIPGLAGLHPLKGPNDDSVGPRFLALSDAYDHNLRRKFFEASSALNIRRTVHEGTYAYVSGPTYETRAECRFLLAAGADAVGMSTVPEVVVARHLGLRVLALSLITNVAVIDKPPSALDDQVDLSAGKADHLEVISAASEAAKDIERLICELIEQISLN